MYFTILYFYYVCIHISCIYAYIESLLFCLNAAYHLLSETEVLYLTWIHRRAKICSSLPLPYIPLDWYRLLPATYLRQFVIIFHWYVWSPLSLNGSQWSPLRWYLGVDFYWGYRCNPMVTTLTLLICTHHLYTCRKDGMINSTFLSISWNSMLLKAPGHGCWGPCHRGLYYP